MPAEADEGRMIAGKPNPYDKPVIIIAAWIVSVLACLFGGMKIGTYNMERKAVESGLGFYDLDSTTGDVRFRYRDRVQQVACDKACCNTDDVMPSDDPYRLDYDGSGEWKLYYVPAPDDDPDDWLPDGITIAPATKNVIY